MLLLAVEARGAKEMKGAASPEEEGRGLLPLPLLLLPKAEDRVSRGPRSRGFSSPRQSPSTPAWPPWGLCCSVCARGAEPQRDYLWLESARCRHREWILLTAGPPRTRTISAVLREDVGGEGMAMFMDVQPLKTTTFMGTQPYLSSFIRHMGASWSS